MNAEEANTFLFIRTRLSLPELDVLKYLIVFDANALRISLILRVILRVIFRVIFCTNLRNNMQCLFSKIFGWATFENKAMATDVY